MTHIIGEDNDKLSSLFLCEHTVRVCSIISQPETRNDMVDTAKELYKESTGNSKAIKINISVGIDIMGLPFMIFSKGSMSLKLLLDTGASMNFLRKDVLDELADEVQLMPYKTEFHGIDNVGHEASVYSMGINLGPHEFVEDFQELTVPDALKFDLGDVTLQLDGILGYPFFSKYNACFCYGAKVMYLSLPEEIDEKMRTKAS